MRSNEILDLKFMKVRVIDSEFFVDNHKAVYDRIIKFTDSLIFRREDDKFLCDVQTHVIIHGNEYRILDIDSIKDTVNVIRLKDRTLVDYHIENLKLIGFTLDNEPILEYNV